MDGILLSAARGDTTEPERIVRLARVYELLIFKARGITSPCGNSCGTALLRLHDEKGSLTALWQNLMCAQVFAPFCDNAWKSEGEITTTHVCADESAVYSGSDVTWHAWVFEEIGGAEMLLGMDSPSPFRH